MNTNNLFISLLILTVFGLSSCLKDHCVCPEYYNPVCTSDGIEYFSDCLAECDNKSYTIGTCPITDTVFIKTYNYNNLGYCGWIIEYNNFDFKPITLPDSLKNDSTYHVIEFRVRGDFWKCTGDTSKLFRDLEIVDVIN